MAVETTADRDGLMNTDEFAEAAHWSLGESWDPVAVNVHMERPSALASLGELDIHATEYRARLPAEDLPVGAARGDRLVILDPVTGLATDEQFTVIRPLDYDETRAFVVAHLQLLDLS